MGSESAEGLDAEAAEPESSVMTTSLVPVLVEDEYDDAVGAREDAPPEVVVLEPEEVKRAWAPWKERDREKELLRELGADARW